MRLFKNISTFVFSAIVVLTAFGANANDLLPKDDLLVVFHPVSQQAKAIVSIPNFSGDRASLQILDTDGNLLYKREVNTTNGYAELFNFNKLEAGTYIVKAVSENIESRQVFELSENGQFNLISNVVSFFKPMVTVNGQHLDVKLNNHFGEAVFVKIVDTKGKVVFEDVTYGDVCKRMDLSKLPEGFYTLKVSSGTKNYTKSLEL